MTTDLNALRQSAEKILGLRDVPEHRLPNDPWSYFIEACDTLAAMLPLIDELEACRKDAERYRWLRDRLQAVDAMLETMSSTFLKLKGGAISLSVYNPNKPKASAIDDAIDSEIRKCKT